LNVKVRILKWVGNKPFSNIQAKARNKRYNLIAKQCEIDNVDSIFTAHHQDDLYENFLLRLLRGSGLQGISSFNSLITNYNEKIKIIRPLLNIKKEELIYISKKFFSFYIEDPSNNDDKFKRVRLRKLISELKKEGLNINKLSLTLDNLNISNNAINFYVNQNLRENIHKNIYKSNYILNKNFFEYPDEIIYRSFSNILNRVGEKYYAPRGKSVLRILNMLKLEKNLKITLAGCIIEKFNKSVLISREKGKKS
jgi:tRNA(Ile)-lysidine synthase